MQTIGCRYDVHRIYFNRRVDKKCNQEFKKLEFFEEERPLGIQIFGADIEVMKGCVEIIEEANPNLIDINFGCPVKKVVCKDAGAGILRDIPRMIKLTSEIVKASALPVTVKTRLGWDDASKNIVEVAERLQDIGIAALTIHGRTRAQMYKGSADWTLIGEIKIILAYKYRFSEMAILIVRKK